MKRNLTRRSVVAGTGAAVAGVLGVGTQVTASEHDIPVVIEAVTPEEDLIVLRNTGDEDVDLSGYVIDWEYENDNVDQSDPLPEGTMLPAGAALRIAGGYYDVAADVDFGYEAGRINNDYTDIIALQTPNRDRNVSVFDTSVRDTIDEDPPADPDDGEDAPDETDEGDDEDESDTGDGDESDGDEERTDDAEGEEPDDGTDDGDDGTDHGGEGADGPAEDGAEDGEDASDDGETEEKDDDC